MNNTCPNCHQINLPQAAFCSNCASPLSRKNTETNQPGNQPNYGRPDQNFAQATNSGGGATQKATIALILAIAGFFCCSIFTTIPAIVIGWMEMTAIKNGQSPKEGLQFAQWGFWIGIIATVIHIGGFFIWLFLSIIFAASNPYAY